MIRVIHFDYAKFFSQAIRDGLQFEFKKYPEVIYYDFMKDHSGGSNSLEMLEELLPKYDVLLIHPGLERQSKAFSYQKQFPHLRVALVIPGDFTHYHDEELHGMQIFGYYHINPIIDFVLHKKSA